MGIFDKDSPIFCDKSESGAPKKESLSPDFSDTTSRASSTPNAPKADFSDVSSGQSTSAPDASTGQTYTVKSGDSLSKIAKQVYGDASKWKLIHEANKAKIPNPDLIHPGDQLTIPPKAEPLKRAARCRAFFFLLRVAQDVVQIPNAEMHVLH
jgi:nucleoid-associated protein YgaU